MTKARELFHQAALLGDAESEYRLGLLYAEENKTLSDEWLRKAAHHSFDFAMLEIGRRLRRSDPLQAASWILKSCFNKESITRTDAEAEWEGLVQEVIANNQIYEAEQMLESAWSWRHLFSAPGPQMVERVLRRVVEAHVMSE